MCIWQSGDHNAVGIPRGSVGNISICMYINIYVYVRVCVCACTDACVRVFAWVACRHIRVNTYMEILLCLSLYLSLLACGYVRVCRKHNEMRETIRANPCLILCLLRCEEYSVNGCLAWTRLWKLLHRFQAVSLTRRSFLYNF